MPSRRYTRCVQTMVWTSQTLRYDGLSITPIYVMTKEMVSSNEQRSLRKLICYYTVRNYHWNVIRGTYGAELEGRGKRSVAGSGRSRVEWGLDNSKRAMPFVLSLIPVYYWFYCSFLDDCGWRELGLFRIVTSGLFAIKHGKDQLDVEVMEGGAGEHSSATDCS